MGGWVGWVGLGEGRQRAEGRRARAQEHREAHGGGHVAAPRGVHAPYTQARTSRPVPGHTCHSRRGPTSCLRVSVGGGTPGVSHSSARALASLFSVYWMCSVAAICGGKAHGWGGEVWVRVVSQAGQAVGGQGRRPLPRLVLHPAPAARPSPAPPASPASSPHRAVLVTHGVGHGVGHTLELEQSLGAQAGKDVLPVACGTAARRRAAREQRRLHAACQGRLCSAARGCGAQPRRHSSTAHRWWGRRPRGPPFGWHSAHPQQSGWTGSWRLPGPQRRRLTAPPRP